MRASVIGSLFGFAMAGCGIGSLLGGFFGNAILHTLAKVKNVPDHEREILLSFDMLHDYGTMLTGIFLGFLFGGITGTVYAVYKNRWIDALRAHQVDTPVPASAMPNRAKPTL